jgi:hypothetical protein
VEINGRPLRCLICHNATFWRRSAKVHRGVTSFSDLVRFFDFQWAAANAVLFVCDNCGYIHSFLPSE